MRREFTGQADAVPLILLLFVKQYQMVHVELVARSGQARAPAAMRAYRHMYTSTCTR